MLTIANKTMQHSGGRQISAPLTGIVKGKKVALLKKTSEEHNLEGKSSIILQPNENYPKKGQQRTLRKKLVDLKNKSVSANIKLNNKMLGLKNTYKYNQPLLPRRSEENQGSLLKMALESQENNKEHLIFNDDEPVVEITVSSNETIEENDTRVTNVKPQTIVIPKVKGNMIFYLNEEHCYFNSLNQCDDGKTKTVENSIYNYLFIPYTGLQEQDDYHVHGKVKTNTKACITISHCTGHPDLMLQENETLPKPGQIFESRGKFLEYMNKYAEKWCFYVSCDYSMPGKSVKYACVNRAYKKTYKSKGMRKKDSKKTNCPCMIKLRKLTVREEAVFVTHVCYHHDHPLTKENFLKMEHGKHFPPVFKQEIKDLLVLGIHTEVIKKYVLSRTELDMSFKYFNNMRRIARANPRKLTPDELNLLVIKRAELDKKYGHLIKVKPPSIGNKKKRIRHRDTVSKPPTYQRVKSTLSTDDNTPGNYEESYRKKTKTGRKGRFSVESPTIKESREWTSPKKRQISDEPALDKTPKMSRLESHLEKMKQDKETTLMSVQKLQESMEVDTEWNPSLALPDISNSPLTTTDNEHYDEHYDENATAPIKVPRPEHSGEIHFINGNYYLHLNEPSDTHSNFIVTQMNEGYDTYLVNEANETHETDFPESDNYHVVCENIQENQFEENNDFGEIDETYDEGNENVQDNTTRVNTEIDNYHGNVLTESPAHKSKGITDRSPNNSDLSDTNDTNIKLVIPNDEFLYLENNEETDTNLNKKHIYINKYNISERILEPNVSKYLEQAANLKGVSVLSLLRNIYEGKCGISIKIEFSDKNEKQITVACVQDIMPEIQNRNPGELDKYKRELSLCFDTIIQLKEETTKNKKATADIANTLASQSIDHVNLLSDVESLNKEKKELEMNYERVNTRMNELIKENNILLNKEEKLLSDMAILEKQNFELKINLHGVRKRVSELVKEHDIFLKKEKYKVENATKKIYTLSKENMKLKTEKQFLTDKLHIKLTDQLFVKRKPVSLHEQACKIMSQLGAPKNQLAGIDYIRKKRIQLELDMFTALKMKQAVMKEISDACDLKELELIKSKIREIFNADKEVKGTPQAFKSLKNKTVENKELDVVEIDSEIDKDDINLEEVEMSREDEDCSQLNGSSTLVCEKLMEEKPTNINKSSKDNKYPINRDEREIKDREGSNLVEMEIIYCEPEETFEVDNSFDKDTEDEPTISRGLCKKNNKVKSIDQTDDESTDSDSVLLSEKNNETALKETASGDTSDTEYEKIEILDSDDES